MSASGILIRATVLVCFLQLPLSDVLSPFTYFDEVLALAMIVCFVLRTARRMRVERSDMLVIGLLAALLVFGFVCNMTSGVPRPTSAILQDAFTVIKVFACYLGAKYLFLGRDDCREILGWSASVARLIVIAGVACLPLAHLGLLDMLSSSTRMGMRCFEFIYGSPGMLSQYCVLLTTVLLADLGGKRLAWKRLCLVLDLLLWASTLRTRAFVMIALILFLALVVFRPGLRERFRPGSVMRRISSPLFLVPAAGVTLAVAADQVEHYFGELSSARSYLLDGGVHIFVDYLPLGTGFATYGTETARTYYSPLYTEYGVNAHWALVEGGSELTDTFWPAIMAQFGLVGLLMYVPALLAMLYQVVKGCSSGRGPLLAAVSFVAYTLIASTATGVYFSYTVACCMFLIGIILGVASVDRAGDNDPEGK